MNPIANEFHTLVLALDGLSLRHQVTATNIANQSVPGYKRRTVEFADALEKAAEGGEFRPRIRIDGSEGGPDGNNVDPATEVGALNRIDLAYQTIAYALGAKASMMRAAISGR